MLIVKNFVVGVFMCKSYCSSFASTAPLRSGFPRVSDNTAIFTKVPAKLIKMFKELMEVDMSRQRRHTSTACLNRAAE